MELSADTRSKWLKRAAIGVPLALMAAWLADGYLWGQRPAATPEAPPVAVTAPAVAPLPAAPPASAVIDLAETAAPPARTRHHAKRRAPVVAVADQEGVGRAEVTQAQVAQTIAPMSEAVAVAPTGAGQAMAEAPAPTAAQPATAEPVAAPFPFSMLAAACALPGELGKSLNRSR